MVTLAGRRVEEWKVWSVAGALLSMTPIAGLALYPWGSFQLALIEVAALAVWTWRIRRGTTQYGTRVWSAGAWFVESGPLLFLVYVLIAGPPGSDLPSANLALLTVAYLGLNALVMGLVAGLTSIIGRRLFWLGPSTDIR